MKQRKPLPEAEIPTSSLADVAFLLIVFFVITQTVMVNRGLDMAVPPKETPTETIDPVESVHVQIRPDSTLVVDGHPMNNGDLVEYLAPRLRMNPDKPVILHPDGDAPYGAMVATFDLLRGARQRLGLEKEVQIVLPTETEIGGLY